MGERKATSAGRAALAGPFVALSDIPFERHPTRVPCGCMTATGSRHDSILVGLLSLDKGTEDPGIQRMYY